jgi:hypothetical protein
MLCFEYAAHWRKILTAGEIWVYNLVDTTGEVLPYHCKAVALSSTTSILVVIRGEAIRRVQERETALLADAIMEFDNIIGQPAGR